MGYVFISYISKNQTIADTFRKFFNKHNIDTWMAPYSIPVGSQYAEAINQAIKNCSCLLLLLTDASQNSPWVSKEVERALHYNKAVIPVQLEPLILNDTFEYYISTCHIIKMYNFNEHSLEMQDIFHSISVHTSKTNTVSQSDATRTKLHDEHTIPNTTSEKIDGSHKQQRFKITKNISQSVIIVILVVALLGTGTYIKSNYVCDNCTKFLIGKDKKDNPGDHGVLCHKCHNENWVCEWCDIDLTAETKNVAEGLILCDECIEGWEPGI